MLPVEALVDPPLDLALALAVDQPRVYFGVGVDILKEAGALAESLLVDLLDFVEVNLFFQLNHVLQLAMMESTGHEDVVAAFPQTLEDNRAKAELKKEEYLERIMQIFREFVSKSEQEIDRIISRKLEKLQENYLSVVDYLEREGGIAQEERSLIVTEYLVKPFEKFPFSGNKNEKIFREQYNLVEKASLLIEQTLVDSFNEQQIPNFQNAKFFASVRNNGLGEQSLTKLALSPQNLALELREEFSPLQKNIHSLKMMGEYLILVGDEAFLEIWDLEYTLCVKKLYLDVIAPVTCLSPLLLGDLTCLAVGFGDQSPEIAIYRTDDWSKHGCNLAHTRSLTKIVQLKGLIFSGSVDGNVCVYSAEPFKHLHTCPHISSVEDLICKNSLVYVLLKCSSLCEYELQWSEGEAVLHFRRTLSTGFISMIRFTEVGSNFSGVACHIYGLSQIEITRKFRVEETNIINVSEMIADFVVVESKATSEYYAVCGFQNSSAIRIYSLKSGAAIYEISSDYLGEVGVAGYIPKVEIAWVKGHYWIIIVNQSQFETGNSIRMYQLQL